MISIYSEMHPIWMPKFESGCREKLRPAREENVSDDWLLGNQPMEFLLFRQEKHRFVTFQPLRKNITRFIVRAKASSYMGRL